jgi:hypothetical protein
VRLFLFHSELPYHFLSRALYNVSDDVHMTRCTMDRQIPLVLALLACPKAMVQDERQGAQAAARVLRADLLSLPFPSQLDESVLLALLRIDVPVQPFSPGNRVHDASQLLVLCCVSQLALNLSKAIMPFLLCVVVVQSAGPGRSTGNVGNAYCCSSPRSPVCSG